MLPNSDTNNHLIPQLASISNAGITSFTSNDPVIDPRARISDIGVSTPYLSTAPMVWTLNSVDVLMFDKLYERYLELAQQGLEGATSPA
jgi:hypothetical protein